MRSTLFEIPFNGSVNISGVAVPLFGFGIVLAVWCLIGLFFLRLRLLRGGWGAVVGGGVDSILGIAFWFALCVVIIGLPQLAARRVIPAQWPVFGWGAMLFLGFFTAAQLGSRRLKQHGFDGEIAWDIAFWGVPAGIVGARVFHVIQYWRSFAGQPLWKLFNLPDGGLVFYGGLLAGVATALYYCHRKKLNMLQMADLLVPSILIGLAFGRLGCFMNGCCYGDVCSLPWAMSFPQKSPPFAAQVTDGLISSAAPFSLPVHPTQLYSALDGFVLALLTWTYYPFRRRHGDVVVLALVAHGISRFLIEFVRADEKGQFGTMLTISQWISLGLAGAGIALAFVMYRTSLLRSVSMALPAARTVTAGK